MTYDDLVSLLRDLGLHRKPSLDDGRAPEVSTEVIDLPSGGTVVQQILDGSSKWSKYTHRN